MTKSVFGLVALALAAPVFCSGQDSRARPRLGTDRVELTRLLGEFEGVVQSTAYSDVLRGEAQAEADLIRERLTNGDFRVGERIALHIESAQPVPWDTLTVEAGPAIDVPILGSIPLGGILRSELESHLSTEVSRFVQEPRVRARALIRVTMLGVGAPGFRTFAADLPLSDVIMLAGGPGGGADPGQISIERREEVLWTVEELVGPLAEGRTLDELGVQAGDRIIVQPPASTGGGVGRLQGQLLQRLSFIVAPLIIRMIIG